jgi:cytochrome c1
LNNVGNWLTPAWIEAWLRNPQALVPGAIEPRRQFTEEEIKSLTAYLMTLRVGIEPQKMTLMQQPSGAIAGVQGAGR